MNDSAAGTTLSSQRTRYHVIVNPNRILGMKEMEGPRSYDTREAADSECGRLNGAAGTGAYLVIATSK
jgi:hypothetical protein